MYEGKMGWGKNKGHLTTKYMRERSFASNNPRFILRGDSVLRIKKNGEIESEEHILEFHSGQGMFAKQETVFFKTKREMISRFTSYVQKFINGET